MEEIKVAIVEDDNEIREGLAYMLSSSPGLKCVGKFSDAESFLKEADDIAPDILLEDINLPGISGIECVRRLKQKKVSPQVMMLTIYEDYDAIFNSLKAGATGYILKKSAPSELIAAIKELYNGGSPMSSQIARKVVSSFLASDEPEKKAEHLSVRENEILNYLSKGYRYKEIAANLFISVETVRTHIRNIYEKLHVNSRTEALLKAYPNNQH